MYKKRFIYSIFNTKHILIRVCVKNYTDRNGNVSNARVTEGSVISGWEDWRSRRQGSIAAGRVEADGAHPRNSCPRTLLSSRLIPSVRQPAGC